MTNRLLPRLRTAMYALRGGFLVRPLLIAIALGLDPTRTLVMSQVVLSFALPIPVITLIMFTRNRTIMGSMVNRRLTTVLAIVCAAVILSLNVVLLYTTFGGQISFGGQTGG